MVEPYQNTGYFFGIDSILPLKQCNNVLDCAPGPSSFVAEANKLGVKVVGCDPLFGSSSKILAKRGKRKILTK